MEWEQLKFDDQGLLPAVIQDEATNAVLMVAYMNKEALEKTLASGVTWFFSRSRGRLWQKGETSGHVQKVKDIFYDCDGDTLLVKVEQSGVACHEGTFSCFSRRLENKTAVLAPEVDASEVYGASLPAVLGEVYDVIHQRKMAPVEGSYTTYLFEKGQDKILKKVGEEAAETIMAAKDGDRLHLVWEVTDLWFHCMVLLAQFGLSVDDVPLRLVTFGKALGSVGAAVVGDADLVAHLAETARPHHNQIRFVALSLCRNSLIGNPDQHGFRNLEARAFQSPAGA